MQCPTKEQMYVLSTKLLCWHRFADEAVKCAMYQDVEYDDCQMITQTLLLPWYCVSSTLYSSFPATVLHREKPCQASACLMPALYLPSCPSCLHLQLGCRPCFPSVCHCCWLDCYCS